MPMQINSSQLLWNLSGRTFTGEASELAIAPGEDAPRFIDVISEWTGALVSTFRTSIDLDEHGVVAWHYAPVDPGYNFKMIIFND